MVVAQQPVHSNETLSGHENRMQSDHVPGALVVNPAQPDWGIGQVQSAIGTKVTVNFENMGKIVVNTAIIDLELIDHDDLPGD